MDGLKFGSLCCDEVELVTFQLSSLTEKDELSGDNFRQPAPCK